MSFLFLWVLYCTLGGSAAAIITFTLFYVSIYGIDFFLLFKDDGFFFPPSIAVLIGSLHGGCIGIIQWLLLLKQIPDNKQSLKAACLGTFIGLVSFGLIFNFSFWLARTFIYNTSYINNFLFTIPVQAAVAGSIQGLIQHRILRRQKIEIPRWCISSIVSSILGLIIVLLMLKEFEENLY